MSAPLDIIQNFNFAGLSVLSELFNNSTTNVYQLINHGCWCSKIDPTRSTQNLGGSNTVDSIDEICKSWFQCRHCNEYLVGGECYQIDDIENYMYQIEGSTQACTLDTLNNRSACESSSCIIDLHYASQIQNYIENDLAGVFNNFEITDSDFTTCSEKNLANVNAIKTCTGNAPNKVIEATYSITMDLTQAQGATCADQGQGICFLVETSTDTASETDGQFKITVTTTSGKVSSFTVGGFYFGDTLKMCDCRPSDTFNFDETVQSVEVAAVGNEDSWKIKSLVVDINPGPSFSFQTQSTKWFLDPKFSDGFWVDGDDDCLVQTSPCCTNYQTCALTPRLEVSQNTGTACAAAGEGICAVIETATDYSAGDSSGNFGILMTTDTGIHSYFTVGNFALGQIVKVCDCRPASVFNNNEVIQSVSAAAISSEDGWKIKEFIGDINPGSQFTSINTVLSGQASNWLLDQG